MILGRPNIRFTYNDLEIIEENTFEDLESALLIYAKQGALLWIKGNPVYADDIRADYINKVLYAPVFMCDTAYENGKVIKYNNRIEKQIIHSYRDGYRVGSLTVQRDIGVQKASIIELGNLPLRKEASNLEKQASDLFHRYIAYSYMYHKSEDDLFKFIRVQASKMSKYQREYIKSHKLSFYGQYEDMEYRDVRRWKLIELKGKIPDEMLLLGESFGYRRLNFELELYSRLYSKDYWDDWTLGTMNDLLNNKRDYLKYKYNNIYLIFKKSWL